MKHPKVLIINPPVRLDDKPRNLPHGLAILANVIKREMGLEPLFLDVNAHRYSRDRMENMIRHIDSDVVLMGGVSSTYGFVTETARFIKKLKPGSRVIVGGYVAMPVPELLLENSEVDIVCTGEGEITIVELLKKFHEEGLSADLSDLTGIYYKAGNKVCRTPDRPYLFDLDRESAPPCYDLLPMDIYLSNTVVGVGRDVDMITIRGCPFRCSFCYQPWGHKPRLHSVDFIINSIRYLKKNYDIDFVSFQDDEFMVYKKRVEEFCRERNRYFPDLLWSCTGRANFIAYNEETVELMRNSGCTLISCGFESGSQRMLDSMRKAQTIGEMEETVRILRKHGMPVPASFIIGMPGENEESCQETLDFCIRNNLPLDSLMFATPYPGAEIFDFAVRTRRINRGHLHEFMMKLGDARDFLINLTDAFEDEQLIQMRRRMMDVAKENYNRFISRDEIMGKMNSLYGGLVDRNELDEKDLQHKMEHGGVLAF